MDGLVVGVLGGGQLGRMLSQAASRLSVPLVTLDSPASPAAQLSQPHLAFPYHEPPLAHFSDSFSDPDAIRAFARQVDILTVEIEHVNVSVLKEIKADANQGRQGRGVQIRPSPEVIEIIQDKWRQKEHLASHGIPVADFLAIPEAGEPAGTEDAVRIAGEKLDFPLMLKSRLLAYDGRGNALVRTSADVPGAVLALTPKDGKPLLYAERFAPFACEIAVMVVRGSGGDVRVYPPVETVHRNNVCHLVYAPLRKGGPEASRKATEIAKNAVIALGEGAVGVFGVEMFLMPDGTVLVNEIAPRPHNSYHHTLASTPVSQFTAHLLAILALPLPPPCSFVLAVPSAAMLNLLGGSDGEAGAAQVREFVRKASLCAGVSVELYGKSGCRKGRKMGHVNIVGASDAEVASRLLPLLAALPEGGSPSNNATQTSDPLPGFSHPHPLVSIVMGSDSDLPTMLAASSVLGSAYFRVPHELTIVSAHRTPIRMVDFAHAAASRGVKVIIAGAGGAAHLPGMVAALTPLPVIGVPVKGSTLDGVDSLHSIVQMPRGVPVATVAIGNATNAGLLAVRILSAGDPRLAEAMEVYMKDMEKGVMEKVESLKEVGWDQYKVVKS